MIEKTLNGLGKNLVFFCFNTDFFLFEKEGEYRMKEISPSPPTRNENA